MADIDYKNIGLKALDVVVGIGSAVAGGYGGPAAAQGVQMAGGAIKDGINDATGSGDQSRADKHDRADFQARARVTEPRRAPTQAPDDAALTRSELLAMGWSAEQADRIIAGPATGVTLASLVETDRPAEQRTVPEQEPERQVRRVRGQRVASADAQRVTGQDGATVKGVQGQKVDEYEGSSALSSIGKIISGVMKG